jgi:putative FmdB family regulatory protein
LVPTYEYQCSGCNRTFEVRQRITAEPLTQCEVCGGAVKRLLSPAPFILKGKGWYVTDYPSEARKKAVASEKTGGDTKDGSSGEKSSTTSTAETSSSSSSSSPSSSSTSSSSSSTPPPASKPSTSD